MAFWVKYLLLLSSKSTTSTPDLFNAAHKIQNFFTIVCFFFLLADGHNMTSNNNGSHEEAGGLRLDCSSAAGAPTLTTPTLTPTTLRNIGQNSH